MARILKKHLSFYEQLQKTFYSKYKFVIINNIWGNVCLLYTYNCCKSSRKIETRLKVDYILLEERK